MVMKLIPFALLSLGQLARIMDAAVTSQSSHDGEMYVRAYSTATLNALFEQQGYERKFWTYSSAPTIRPDSSRSTLVLQSSLHDHVFRVDHRGIISAFAKARSGVYFLGDDGSPSMIFGDGSIEIRDVGKFDIIPGEYVPLVDPHHRFYVRCFKKADGGHDFAVFDGVTMKELMSDSGRAQYAESSGEDAFVVVTADVSGKGHRIKSYRKNACWQLTETVEIPAPDALRENSYFGFGDLDIARRRVVFTEYSVPGSLFERDRIWVYDFGKHEYLFMEELKRTGGHIYAFFLPDRFTGSFALWSKKLDP